MVDGPGTAGGRTIPALVDVTWVRERLGEPGLVVLDVRDAGAYAAGHVPGSVNEPFAVPVSAWTAVRDGLLLSLPDAGDLRAVLDRLGIGAGSRVVVVGAPAPAGPAAYGMAAATRVAFTLILAGVPDVAVLDGGHPRWAGDGAPTSTHPAGPAPIDPAPAGSAPADGAGAIPLPGVLVSREEVAGLIGSAVLVDARDPDVYVGRTVEEFAPRAGHLPTARSLPAVWIWQEDGTYAPTEQLRRLAAGVIGSSPDQEVVVYCGVGGYASSWWFLLTQLLGYTAVRFYDGSAQEWVRDGELVAFRWE